MTPGNGDPASSARPPGVIDHAMLEKICGGDAAIQRQLLLEFRRVNDADIATLLQAIDAGDQQKCLKLLHRIKGAAKGLAAVDLISACEGMERSARTKPTTGLVAELQNFSDALQRLNAHLDSIGVRG